MVYYLAKIENFSKCFTDLNELRDWTNGVIAEHGLADKGHSLKIWKSFNTAFITTDPANKIIAV